MVFHTYYLGWAWVISWGKPSYEGGPCDSLWVQGLIKVIQACKRFHLVIYFQPVNCYQRQVIQPALFTTAIKAGAETCAQAPSMQKLVTQSWLEGARGKGVLQLPWSLGRMAATPRAYWIRRQAFRQQLLKSAEKPFRHRLGAGQFCLLPLHWALGDRLGDSALTG